MAASLLFNDGAFIMITLEQDALVFRFPDIHPEARADLRFMRTLRIPDDNRDYPLPPGLGRFPLRWATDALGTAVLLPMYQSEAMWISLGTGAFRDDSFPCAIRIAAGDIDALTGERWREGLQAEPQNYLVSTLQPWLDGFCVQKDLIRQFVAMPLGQGYTAEEQLLGDAARGGLRISVYPMKQAVWEALQRQRAEAAARRARQAAMLPEDEDFVPGASCCQSLGLAPGGLMRQQIYRDSYGLDAWDQRRGLSCTIHLLNSAQWQAATGEMPPGKAPSAQDYTAQGLPWFEYFSERPAVPGPAQLAQLDSVATRRIKQGLPPMDDERLIDLMWELPIMDPSGGCPGE